MVPGGRRHATGDVLPFGKAAALRTYLSLAGRGEMAALLRVIQEIARRLSGVLSTISRELRRNGAIRSGGCDDGAMARRVAL